MCSSYIPIWRCTVPSGFNDTAAGIASNGSKANIGITAMSCVNKTEKVARPPAVCTNPFSASVCNTIAVEDNAKIKPIASDVAQSKPINIAAPIMAAVVTVTCNPPRPISLSRISHKARGSSSNPIRNSIMTTPNSAKCIRSWDSVPTNPVIGPMTIPASRYPSTDPRPSRAARGTAITAAPR